MQKIPTLFVRDPEDRRYVTREVTPGCEWVLAGEGVATRKWDGTCILINDDHTLWARREVKTGKQAPPNFTAVQIDHTTGKVVGWEPAEQSSYAKILDGFNPGEYDPGTYELVGPKVNGNPDGFQEHTLVPHGGEPFDLKYGRTFDGIRAAVGEHPDAEGIVFHHPDGRMAKIKRRDFPATVSVV